MNHRIKKKVAKRKKMWYNPDFSCPVVTTTYHDYKFMHKLDQAYIIKYRRTYGRVSGCSYEDMLRYVRRRTKSVFVALPGMIL